ncbi:hypothetical protein [Microbulbifer aggregans]|uniref:hypothetical protein n=1 Tax=Microbulbifer aggregans TaxID=1769779 RepID=UPI001CFDF137|nr:hypothetical protein [Microbulbifer aggregans]
MYKKLALALAVTALAACGGGGGSSSPDTGGGNNGGNNNGGTGTGTDNPIPVGGTAAKGIISGAQVVAKSDAGEVLGSAVTAEDGSYSIELDGYSGAVRLELSAPESGIALVTCDTAQCRTAGENDQDSNADGVITFAEQYALDYTLSSVVFVEESATALTSSITALTTLVAEKAGATPDQASISAANTFVKDTFGLDADPSTVAPVDLTSATSAGEQDLRFALINAAIEAAAEGGDVAAQLESLSAGFAANTVDAAVLESVNAAIDSVATATSEGNNELAGVADAAAGAVKATGDAIAENCANGTCTPEVEVTGDLASNLEQAKALVATVRKVSVEALEAIKSELDETSVGYNQDNLVVQMDSAAQVLTDDNRDNIGAIAEVAGLLAEQIFRDIEGEQVFTSLSAAAAAAYGDAEHCEWVATEYQEQCLAEYEAEKAAYVAQFATGSIVQEGQAWSVADALFDADGNTATTEDQVAIDLTIGMPEIQSKVFEGEERLYVDAGAHVLAISGMATLGDSSFKINEGSGFSLELSEELIDIDVGTGEGEDPLGEPQIENLALNLDAEIINATHRFNGSVEITGEKSEAMYDSFDPAMNDKSAHALLPEKLALSGVFEELATAKSLEAAVVVTIDNADDFLYVLEGFERDDLTSYSYNAADNTVTVKIGEENNYAIATYALSEVVYDEYYSDFYVTVSCNEVVGDASCPAQQEYYFWGLNDVRSDLTQLECESEYYNGYWEWESSNCYIWVSPENSNVMQDLRVAFTAEYSYMLDGLYAGVAGEGWYRAGPSEWWPNYVGKSVFSGTSGTIAAELVESDINFDAEDRYLKATFRVSAHGNLSANLPAMDVELVAKRTGYEVAEVILSLAWGNDSLRVEYPVSSEGSNTIILSDGKGAEFSLELATDGETVTGVITKDGTVYGTLAEENNAYVITWIDNGIETLL